MEPVSKDTRSTDSDAAAERSINTGKLKRSTPQLQKVVGGLACCVRLDLPRRWIKLEEVMIHVFPNLKNRGHVTTSVTVVWCTENRYNILILHEKIRTQ